MKPQMMAVAHLPPEQFGDCYRACIASILEVPVETVPHCGVRGEVYWEEEHKKLDSWLAERDLYIVHHIVTASNIDAWSSLGYHVFGGRSSRGPHFTVGLGGKMVHDPSPLGGPFTPDADGTYTIGYLARGATP